MTDKVLTLAEIEALIKEAEKAAPGPYIVDKDRPGIVLMPSVDAMAGMMCGRSAPFVAACSPDTIIALCKAAQREDGLRRALKNLLAEHSDHNCGEAGCPVDEARDALHFAELAAITGGE